MINTRRPLAGPPELAEFLRLDEQTLANWRWRGTGPRWFKAGTRVRYAWDDVDAWLRDQGSDAATGQRYAA